MRLKIFKYKELSREELKKAILKPNISRPYFFVLYYVCILINFIVFTIALANFLKFLHIFLFLEILIFPIILLVLRVVFNYWRQIAPYDIYYDKSLLPIVNAFKIYLGCKGKRRDNKKINFIIKRIEVADRHFKKLNAVYNSCYFFYIASLVLLIELGLLPQQNFMSFQNVIVLLLFDNFFFLAIFMIRSYHFKNLKQSRFLFDYVFIDELNSIYSNLEKITFYKIRETSDYDIFKILRTWHKLFCGIYHIESEDCDDLIYENRLSYADISELDKYNNLFNTLKINLLNEKIGKNSGNSVETLLISLNNYIEMLEFKIKEKTKEETKKNKKFQVIQSTIVITISVTSLLFSIT